MNGFTFRDRQQAKRGQPEILKFFDDDESLEEAEESLILAIDLCRVTITAAAGFFGIFGICHAKMDRIEEEARFWKRTIGSSLSRRAWKVSL